MKLGIITDVHEHVEYLQVALNRFHIECVDQVVVLGDVYQMGLRLGETCRLLNQERVIGVWGNHDYGLCVDPSDELRRKYGSSVIDFMKSLRPSLELAECYFAHVEPWLNPEVLEDLWYFEGPPDNHQNLERIFSAVPNRLVFAGHYHSWLIASPDRIEDWNGKCSVRLDRGRYFVVIGALCEGCCATFDTDTCELVPFNKPNV